MRVRAAALVCLLAGLVALAGCGADHASQAQPLAAATPSSTDGPELWETIPTNPPEVVLRTADGVGEATLPRSPGCWSGDTGGSCVDVVAAEPDPASLPILAGAGPVTFDFPIAGWTFTATVTDFPDVPHAKPSRAIEVEQPVTGRFVITPPSGTTDLQVALTGRGAQGTFQGAFRWQVAAPAQLPEVVEWDGDGYGPPITLDLDGERIDLDPWTTCYSKGCADGFPRPPYVDVGQRDAVPFSFPDAGWTFEATFRTGDYDDCPRAISVPVRKTGERTFEVTPAGPPRRWLVDVFGRGPGGDVITTFTWTTSGAGALPGPATGSAAVLADHDGELDSYGVELFVQDLVGQPTQASATITVTSAGGESVTLTPTWERECYSEGSLSFTAPDDEGRRATQLGAGPFTYDVALTMDGTTYHGLGTWPVGETEDTAPHVTLTWTPELPAYEG